jgi:hypothetical protein
MRIEDRSMSSERFDTGLKTIYAEASWLVSFSLPRFSNGQESGSSAGGVSAAGAQS